jgi:uncharacterized integral membrane protein
MRDPGDLSPDRTPSPHPEGMDPDRKAEEERQRQASRARSNRIAKVVVVLFLIGVFIAFIVSNSESVDVNFVFLSRKPALIWVMFFCGLIGGIIGYLIGRPSRQPKERRKKDEP